MQWRPTRTSRSGTAWPSRAARIRSKESTLHLGQKKPHLTVVDLRIERHSAIEAAHQALDVDLATFVAAPLKLDQFESDTERGELLFETVAVEVIDAQWCVRKKRFCESGAEHRDRPVTNVISHHVVTRGRSISIISPAAPGRWNGARTSVGAIGVYWRIIVVSYSPEDCSREVGSTGSMARAVVMAGS